MHFPDLKPNSYDNLNNMKLDLNVSTKQGQISCKKPGPPVKNLG